MYQKIIQCWTLNIFWEIYFSKFSRILGNESVIIIRIKHEKQSVLSFTKCVIRTFFIFSLSPQCYFHINIDEKISSENMEIQILEFSVEKKLPHFKKHDDEIELFLQFNLISLLNFRRTISRLKKFSSEYQWFSREEANYINSKFWYRNQNTQIEFMRDKYLLSFCYEKNINLINS